MTQTTKTPSQKVTRKKGSPQKGKGRPWKQTCLRILELPTALYRTIHLWPKAQFHNYLRRKVQNYLRVIIIPKSFCKGVVIYFQLCDLEKTKKKKRLIWSHLLCRWIRCLWMHHHFLQGAMAHNFIREQGKNWREWIEREKRERFIKVMRNMFKLMMPNTKGLLSISSPTCSRSAHLHILKILVTKRQIFKGTWIHHQMLPILSVSPHFLKVGHFWFTTSRNHNCIFKSALI